MNQFRPFVIKRYNTLVKNYKCPGLILTGTEIQTYKYLGPYFRNEVQRCIFPGVTKGTCCEACGTRLGLQRSHAGRTRRDIAMDAIRATECDASGGKDADLILIKFVSLHENEPIQILCEPCHRKFEKKSKPPAVKPVVPKPPAVKRPAVISITKRQNRDIEVPCKLNCRYHHLGCQSQFSTKNSLSTHVSRVCKFKPTSSGGGSVSPGAGRRTC